MKLLKTIMILTVFCACKNTNSPETPKNTAIELDTIAKEAGLEKRVSFLFSKVDKLRLREKPGSKGKVLEQISESEALIDLHEKTDYTEKIKLRDKWHEEPWLKVQSEKGNIGWVYGGAVSSEAPKADITKTPYDDCESAFAASRNAETYYKCIEKVAAEQLQKDARYIEKVKDGYVVTLLGGETRNLVNSAGDASADSERDFREYAYRYYLDKMGFFVFKIHRYEGGDYILMNDKFGYATPVPGMPKMSPDRKKILIWNADAEAGFEFNGIQLLEITDDGIETVFEENMNRFAPYNPVWIDDRNVELDFLSPDNEAEKFRVKAKLSMNDAYEWKLTINNVRE